MRRQIDGRPSRSTRQPAVAGSFYPSSARHLGDLVDSLLDAVAVPDDDVPASAYVVPHAGYRYSGPTAATGYARLRRHADRITRVVLIGPAHHLTLYGCVAPAADRWATPLGEVPVDQETIGRLAEAGLVAVDDLPHAPEHSLEVQVPFLQRVLPGVPLVPIVVSSCPVDEVAALLAAVAGPGCVVLCSTDLSHYLDLAAAQARDARTVRAVLDLAPERIRSGDACGLVALCGMVGWARTEELTAYLLDQCTSADSSGDPSRVVGYAAFAFH